MILKKRALPILVPYCHISDPEGGLQVFAGLQMHEKLLCFWASNPAEAPKAKLKKKNFLFFISLNEAFNEKYWPKSNEFFLFLEGVSQRPQGALGCHKCPVPCPISPLFPLTFI